MLLFIGFFGAYAADDKAAKIVFFRWAHKVLPADINIRDFACMARYTSEREVSGWI